MVLLPHSLGATVTPPPSRVGSTPGAAIRERRLEISKRQEDLANDAEVSQKLISELERGEQELTAVGIGRVSNIARALGWTLNEMQEATGLDFAVETPTDDISSTPFDPRTLFHPPTQQKRVKRDLSPNLSQMIAEKQEKYPQLQETRWQQHLNQTRFANGQEPDADGWFEMYQALRRNNVEPEPWPDD